MTGPVHCYQLKVEWTGNRGSGTSSYDAYHRSYRVSATGKSQHIDGSSDPTFLGDPASWNPEEMLVAALSACHQLWYLHLCADSGIIVGAYVDEAYGEMAEDAESIMRFRRVVLRPRVSINQSADRSLATSLHAAAAKACFIAQSVNFPVHHEPHIRFE